MSITSEQNSYCACRDPNRPVCKTYVNGKCDKHDKCKFYHPKVITTVMKQNVKRQLGKCFCGALLRTIIRDIPNHPLGFFVVCSHTNRSIYKCRH